MRYSTHDSARDIGSPQLTQTHRGWSVYGYDESLITTYSPITNYLLTKQPMSSSRSGEATLNSNNGIMHAHAKPEPKPTPNPSPNPSSNPSSN